jgi:tRNA G37 N-methylase TrmD
MFLEFVSAEARRDFLRRAEESRPDLLALLMPAKTQERIVTVSGGEATQRQEIQELASGKALVFGEVQFETFDERG